MENTDFLTTLGHSTLSVGYDATADLFFLKFEDEDLLSRTAWKMLMNREQAEKVCRGFMKLLGLMPLGEKHREKLSQAIKTAECFSVDYGDMSAEEIQKMDDALELIFQCARIMAKGGGL